MNTSLNEHYTSELSASSRHPFLVIHPLDDRPEEKVRSEHLPPMAMTPSVRLSLLALRGYILTMILMVIYHVLDLAGLFHH